MEIKIKKDEVKQIFDVLYKEIIDKFEEDIEFENDYYWYIRDEEFFNVDKGVSVNEIGQISEDIEFLKRLIADDDSKLDPVHNNLIKFGILLRAIKEEYMNKRIYKK